MMAYMRQRGFGQAATVQTPAQVTPAPSTSDQPVHYSDQFYSVLGVPVPSSVLEERIVPQVPNWLLIAGGFAIFGLAGAFLFGKGLRSA